MDITHNPSASRFEAGIGESRAVLDYEISGDTVIVTHTEVPPALRGQGIAEKLTRAMLAWLAETGKRVEPRCAYVANFIDRNPEFQRLRAVVR